jgi:hypothetical protein
MMKKILLAAGLSTILLADPFGTAPGTKARAMGGAFTALANNTSALYFNPAGLIVWEEGMEEYGTLTAEVGTAIKLDVEEGRKGDGNSDFIDSYTNYFWGFSHFGESFGWALGSYSLNSFNNPYTINGQTEYLLQENKIVSGALAFKLTDSLYPGGGKISIGATVGYAWTDDFFASTENGSGDQVEAESVIWSVGLKARLLQSDNVNVDFGVNYRAQTDYEPNDYSHTDVVPWDIPEELALGVAVIVPTEFATITMTYDYKATGYEEATEWEAPSIEEVHTKLGGFGDVTTHSVGAEFAFESFQLRAGYYTDSVDGDYGNNMESDGISGGVAVTLGNWNLEAAVERKNIETTEVDTIDTDETYYSASINYTF